MGSFPEVEMFGGVRCVSTLVSLSPPKQITTRQPVASSCQPLSPQFRFPYSSILKPNLKKEGRIERKTISTISKLRHYGVKKHKKSKASNPKKIISGAL